MAVLAGPLFYLVVAGFVLYILAQFWLGYFNELFNLLGE